MRKLILILLLIPFILKAQSDITFQNEYCEIITGDTLYLSGYFENVRVESPFTVVKHSKLNTLSVDLYPDYPAYNTPVYKGEIYKYNNQLIQVVQDHNITIYAPEDVPALFSFYRDETGELEWIENEVVAVGDIRTYQSQSYECLQSHMTLSSWIPTNTLGVLWKIIQTGDPDCETVKEWDVNDHWTTYSLGDKRTNAGKLWEVINVGFTYYEPSGTYGSYGWKYLKDCP